MIQDYSMTLPIQGTSCLLRRWSSADAEALVKHANDKGVAENLRDAFPHPYTLADAVGFLEHVVGTNDPNLLCIEVDGEAAGGVGVKLLPDVERVGAEMGYWLGRSFWGRGVVTEAVTLSTPFFMETFELTRVFALPFTRNTPSVRVLEKSGYTLEGRLRKSAIKDGVIQDQFMYAYV
ncbi:MAG: ribosomal-protein-alanine N-acetyltransferase [Planctomycetota bacterium]